MFLKLRTSLCGSLAALASAVAFGQAAPAARPVDDTLEREFLNPPASARPRVWWHWMNGNITKEGIKLDLEWMKRVGIGGFQNFDAALNTPQVVEKRLPYMTPEWKDAFRYAAGLADELGLEMAIASSPGWSETGGPWVKPPQGMKKFVWSETRVEGGKQFTGTIPKPPTVTGPFQAVPFRDDLAMGAPTPTPPEFYADAVVIAYRVPGDGKAGAGPASVTSSGGSAIDVSLLSDGDLVKGVKLPIDKQHGAWIQHEYAAPRSIQAVSVATPPGGMFMPVAPVLLRLETSDDGRTFRPVADLPTGGTVQHTVSFPPVSSRYFRLTIQATEKPSMFAMFEGAPGVDSDFAELLGPPPGNQSIDINEFVLYSEARVNRFEEKACFGLVPDYYALAGGAVNPSDAVRPADVVDLTSRMRPDGSLDWTPPKGRWVVLRLGYSLTGTLNHPATAEATGLEVDKLNRNAVKAYMDTYLATYAETLGPSLMGHKGVRALLTDSIEVGAYNWTDDLLAQFRQLRGYDATPFLPVLTGVVVGSTEQSDNFLWDFRRTLAELTAQSHYEQISKSAHEHGLTYYGESLEGTRVSIGDDMEMRQHADIPMSAMWTYTPARGPRPGYIADIRGAASVAHVYGQNLVAAESLTSAMVPWGFSPRILKPIIDLEFALGVNRPVIHTSVHQPLVNKKPGLSLMIFGQYFNRNETWAEQAGPWVSYLSRNAYMLQQGKFGADVAYFYGEEAPLAGLYGENSAPPKDVPEGYGFDYVNSDIVLHQLSAVNGALETQSGMRYRVLYLGGSSQKMTLPVLRKLRALVSAGAIVVGNRPTGSPSLADSAAEFTKLADSLWGPAGSTTGSERAVGKGKVIFGKDVNKALASLGVGRDFDYDKPKPDSELMFVHRRLADGELYFVSNRQARSEAVNATFRVAGKRPEVWHAETGQTEPITYRTENGRTTVALNLGTNESVFVVFRKPAASPAETIPAPSETRVATLDGNWSLAFAPDLGAPAKVDIDHLASWSESADPGVKYYSGTGSYSRTLAVPAAWLQPGSRLVLDLGEVREVAEVLVNGRSVGIVWHAPYQVDLASAVKPGANAVEVKVTNLWVNRLIGDKQPDAKKYTFTTMGTYKADAPLQPSGLLGPVTIQQVSTAAR